VQNVSVCLFSASAAPEASGKFYSYFIYLRNQSHGLLANENTLQLKYVNLIGLNSCACFGF